ncbi:MAG: hypothetical protein ACE5FY_00700 [Nitrospiria bacterium]
MTTAKKGFLFALMVGMVALTGRVASAQNFVFETETDIMGSRLLGFDPTVNLIPAATNTDASSGPCFTCPNSNAGGTTAGALTNSMFGEIRDNNDADLGDKSFNPGSQDMDIPNAAECGSNCNDAGAFTFNLPLPTQNFLSAGTPVPTTVPAISEAVGKAGVKMQFSNLFEFKADGTSTFAQTVKQTTFTGGMGTDGTSANEIQIVEFEAHSDNPAVPFSGSGGGEIFWTQTIEEGGFFLGPLSGSFVYNDSPFSSASAPTGQGQTNGDKVNIP